MTKPSDMETLDQLLIQADALRFKLLAIVGKDQDKKEKIIQFLQKEEWKLVDLEQELLGIRVCDLGKARRANRSLF